MAVLEGNEDMVVLLLEHPDVLVNKRDPGGNTPLLVAAETGNQRIFELLWTWKKEEEEDKQVALSDSREDIDKQANNKNGQNALMLACKVGNVALVRFMVEHFEDLEGLGEKDEWGYSALSLAASEGYLEIVQLLTETPERRSCFNVNDKTLDTGNNVLMVALLSCGLPERERVAGRQWALKAQAEPSALHILKTWKDGICFDDVNKDGETILMMAARSGCTALVKELCGVRDELKRCKVKLNYVNKQGTRYTALMLAARYGYHGTVKVMLDHCCPKGVKNAQNENEVVDEFDVAITDTRGKTALFLAAENAPGSDADATRRRREDKNVDHVKCVEELLKKNRSCDHVNAITINGEKTAFSEASGVPMRRLLIANNGFDVRSVAFQAQILRCVSSSFLIAKIMREVMLGHAPNFRKVRRQRSNVRCVFYVRSVCACACFCTQRNISSVIQNEHPARRSEVRHLHS